MNKGLFISTLENHSGKTMIVLGIINELLGRLPRVAYFRPFICDENDNHLNTALETFEFDQTKEESYAFKLSEVQEMINKGNTEELLEEVINKYKFLEENNDFVVVEGSDFTLEGSVFEFDLNVAISKNLGIPTILVSSCKDRAPEDFVADLVSANNSYQEKEVKILGMICNKVLPEKEEKIRKEFDQWFSNGTQLYTIPFVDQLSQLTIKEISDALNGKVLYNEEYLQNQIGSYKVGAMQLRNYLTYLDQSCLVITSGDRADIIMGALQAHASSTYPNLSGVILTGGLIPEDSILKLIEGLPSNLPVVSVAKDTYQVAMTIGSLKSNVQPAQTQKIKTSLDLFRKYIDFGAMKSGISNYETDGMTPLMFQYNLLKMARKKKKRIVLPEGKDERILKAAHRLVLQDIVDIIVLGDIAEIKATIARHNIKLDLDRITVINPKDTHLAAPYAQKLFELRKHKMANVDIARDLMHDVSYFGTMMTYMDDADGMVSGAVNTSQHTIRPALQFIKTKPGISVVSSIFFMCLPDRVTVFGDCAINPNPNAEALAEIAISSADSSVKFGIDPKVALLSYSSGSSGKGEEVEKVRKAVDIIKERRPDIQVEGPIQYDAAVDEGVARKKMPDSTVAGHANVFIFPDLNTGNNTYKAVQRETGTIAIGPMLQGLNKPINDLSRGCTVEDVFNTVLITAIQAQDA